MAEEKQAWHRVNYACGFNPSAARKMLKFIFGEYFYRLSVNPETRNFDLYMHKELGGVTFIERFTQEFLDSFQDYFGEKPGFKIFYYKGENLEDL